MQDNLSIFPARSAPRTEPELNLTKVRLYNLPAQLTPLIGREQEIQGACMLLQQPEIRLLTLTGTGGVGKTRLSLHIAEELLDNFVDGVSFVSLAPISDPNLVVPTIAQTLDLKEAPDWSPLEHLKTYLYKKHCLLLLDNFEQVVTAAPVLVELLQSCLHLKLLVTSRTVLRISGEYEFPVPLLTVPDLKHLLGNEALTGYAAVALFVQRARAIKPDFQLTSANARTVAEVCIRLDGLPLAIELAAARIKLLSPQALLVRLSHRLQILTGGVRDAPIRQQTLRNTIAWSYDLLSAEEQRLFRRLSVFIGGCTLEAAEGVCNAANDLGMEVLERVASLIDKSLLQQVEQEGEEPRLVMLETIREYGLECLVASGEMEITRSVHAHYYLILAETAEPQLSGSQQVEWLERLERELDNLRAAMQWLVMRGEAEHAMEPVLRMGGALGGFWEARGLWSEGWNILERMLSSAQSSSASVRAKTLNAAANLATMRGDNAQAEELCMESLTLYRALGDKRGIASSLSLLGYVAKERGQLALAHSLNEEALVLSRAVGYQEGILSGLLALGSLAFQRGEDARARVLLEESLTMSRKQGNKSTLAQSLYLLARVMSLSQGDPATVRSLLAEALVLNRELGDSETTANTLSISGELALDQGDVTTADSFFKESLTLYQELGDWAGIAWTLSLLGRANAARGDYVAARAYYQESLLITMAKNFGLKTASYLEGLAGVVAAQGASAWAARLWGTAETLRETLEAPIPSLQRASYEHWVATARSQLGEKAFAAAWAQGRAMSPEQVLAAQQQVTMPAGQLPAARTKSPIVYPAGLTAREVEILRLVAQGLTDAQVAEQLVVSPRTVSWHLTSIYSKLQVSSRSAATRFVIEHHLV